MKLKTARMEALTDGIFAIVMTVMMVGLTEIFNINPASDADFYKLFSSLGNDFIAYTASFLILGVLWFEHHWQFNYIKNVDPMLVFINIMWFIFVCLIPFTTMLLGNHPKFFAPMIVFELNILIVFSILHIHWVYATHKNHLTEESLESKVVFRHGRSVLLLIVVMFFAAAVSLLGTFSLHESLYRPPASQPATF